MSTESTCCASSTPPSTIIVWADDHGPSSIPSIAALTQITYLAAPTYSLGTRILGVPVLWPGIFREVLNIPKDRATATSIAIDYPHLRAPINTFPGAWERLDKPVEWHGR